MTPGFATILSASQQDRQALFATTAQRLGTAERNVEKDFWVSWTLDALFNGLGPQTPRLLFKGGTSLSKGFGLISRFSEDIDVTVFRQDIGESTSVEELEAMTGRKRQARLDAIKQACQDYIANDLRKSLTDQLNQSVAAAGIAPSQARIEIDPADPDGQSLLLWYPTAAVEEPGIYIRPAVKIESGAKSALDPHHSLTLKPYVADDVVNIELSVANVTTVDAERTFWDKVIILHGLRRWFEHRGVLRAGGQRVSRHYYDVHCLYASTIADGALANRALATDCVRHARMFFNSADLDLASAKPGTFALVPTADMLAPLEQDYAAMAGMIFGDIPDFRAVLESARRVEEQLNAR